MSSTQQANENKAMPDNTNQRDSSNERPEANPEKSSEVLPSLITPKSNTQANGAGAS